MRALPTPTNSTPTPQEPPRVRSHGPLGGRLWRRLAAGLAFGLFALLLGLEGGAQAQPPGGGGPGAHGPPHGPGLGRLIRELELPQATRDQVRAILQEARQRGGQLRQERAEAGQALHELLREDAPSEEAVMAQARTVGAIDSELRLHRLRTLLRIRSLLTPEQRQRLMELRQQRFARAHEACAPDVQRLCPDAEGPQAFRACLHQHREELSQSCREAIPRGRAGRGRHRGPGPGARPPRGRGRPGGAGRPGGTGRPGGAR